MPTLLRIDASARTWASTSRRLADRYQAAWTAAHPEGRVVVRDLAREPLPHLDEPTVAAFHGAAAPEHAPPAGLALSDRLIDELLAADHLLLACPMYNLTLPSTLKAYIDHVVRSGRTFTAHDGRRVGLLAALPVTLVTSRGGLTSPGATDEFLVPYLRAILGFIGVVELDVIALEGTAQDPDTRARQLARAEAQIDLRFTPA